MRFDHQRLGIAVLGALALFGAVLGACGDDAPSPPVDAGVDAGSVDVVTDVPTAVDATTDADDGGVSPSDGSLKHDATPGDAGPCLAQAPVVPPLKLVPVTTEINGFATYAAQPPGSTDWYLVEQAGRIRIIRNGSFLATPPFLDVTKGMGQNFGERGLLSIAFHPNYAQNGRFFTMATPSDANDGSYAPGNADAVVEWKRDPNDPDHAVPTKVRDILVLPESAANHNGGTIKFGPDNYLYVATGDGGGACESVEPGEIQDPTKLFGKVLRLDVDGPAPFAAPNNPFPNDPRVFHYGLRNPYRYNFDRITFDLILGDVGQSAFEELDFVPWGQSGKNFGWPAFEGATQGTCGNNPLGGPSPHAPPIVSIDRRPTSTSPFKDYKSIIGGQVYRGSAIPSLQGVLFFADFSGAELGALRVCNGQVYGPVAIDESTIPATGGVAAISSFIEGNDGELYVTYGFNTRIGRIATQ